MLNALLSRWARTREALSSTFFSRSTQSQASSPSGQRAAGDTIWQSLFRWVPGESGSQARITPRQQALINNVPAAKAEFEASLGGLQGPVVEELQQSIRRAREMRDLWHLRTWLYNEVARQFSQREAEQRLALLQEHFNGDMQPSAARRRRH